MAHGRGSFFSQPCLVPRMMQPQQQHVETFSPQCLERRPGAEAVDSPTALDRPKAPECPPCTPMQTNLAAIPQPEPSLGAASITSPSPAPPQPHLPCLLHTFPPGGGGAKMLPLRHSNGDGSVLLHSLAFPWKADTARNIPFHLSTAECLRTAPKDAFGILPCTRERRCS